jgi:hypothetical protein
LRRAQFNPASGFIKWHDRAHAPDALLIKPEQSIGEVQRDWNNGRGIGELPADERAFLELSMAAIRVGTHRIPTPYAPAGLYVA